MDLLKLSDKEGGDPPGGYSRSGRLSLLSAEGARVMGRPVLIPESGSGTSLKMYLVASQIPSTEALVDRARHPSGILQLRLMPGPADVKLINK